MKIKNFSAWNFTLVELLVVIAIIGILAGILFPAIGSMRENANKTKCVANLNGIGKGLMQYQTTYKVMPNTKSNASRMRAAALIWGGAAENCEIFKCPSASENVGIVETNANLRANAIDKLTLTGTTPNSDKLVDAGYDKTVVARLDSLKYNVDYRIIEGSAPKNIGVSVYVAADGFYGTTTTAENVAKAEADANHSLYGAMVDASGACEKVTDPKWTYKAASFNTTASTPAATGTGTKTEPCGLMDITSKGSDRLLLAVGDEETE